MERPACQATRKQQPPQLAPPSPISTLAILTTMPAAKRANAKATKKVEEVAEERVLSDQEAREAEPIKEKPVEKSDEEETTTKPKPKKVTKKVAAAKKKANADEEDADSDSKSEKSEADTSDTTSDSKTSSKKASPRRMRKQQQKALETALQLMKDGQTAKAIEIVQKLVDVAADTDKAKQDRPPRKPSAYNLFIRDKMPEFKERTDLSTTEKLKLCSEMWKSMKAANASISA